LKSELEKLKAQFLKADAKSKDWADKAFLAVKEGCTRAKITTINANWAKAAEYRDYLKNELKKLEAENNIS
jgi:hypothetical protein